MPQRPRLERLFTDVRPGKGGTAVILFANVFVILCAYYFLARFGDGLAALTVMIGIHVLDASNRTLLVANVVLAVGWLLASFLVAREQGRTVAATASQVTA